MTILILEPDHTGSLLRKTLTTSRMKSTFSMMAQSWTRRLEDLERETSNWSWRQSLLTIVASPTPKRKGGQSPRGARAKSPPTARTCSWRALTRLTIEFPQTWSLFTRDSWFLSSITSFKFLLKRELSMRSLLSVRKWKASLMKGSQRCWGIKAKRLLSSLTRINLKMLSTIPPLRKATIRKVAIRKMMTKKRSWIWKLKNQPLSLAKALLSLMPLKRIKKLSSQLSSWPMKQLNWNSEKKRLRKLQR